MLGLPDRIRACLFDLDGVLTDTASVHRRAWKAMFDEYLRSRAEDGVPYVPFDAGADYERYVDGKPRLDGIRSFLGSRGIVAPDETVTLLGDRKNHVFTQTLHTDGVTVFEGSRRYLQAAAAAGLREGDVILAIDGIAATGADALLRALGGERVGVPAEVVALRGGEVLRVTATPAEREVAG